MDNTEYIENNIIAAEELEAVVIGAILVDEKSSIVFDSLKAEHFYNTAIKEIYRTCVSMHNDNRKIDLRTVANELKSKGRLKAIGGDYFLITQIQKVASSAHIEEHARIIMQYYVRRELKNISDRIKNKAKDDNLDIFDLLDYSKATIENVEKSITNGAGGKTKPKEDINNALTAFLSGKFSIGKGIGNIDFDKYFSFKENEFYLLTGKKGRGKTVINQILQLMGSISNGLVWVVAFQENSEWSMKNNYMNYLLGAYTKSVYLNNRERFDEASAFIDKHFIFLEVETVKDALEETERIIKNGVNVFGLLLDPINTFESGYKSKGNGYADGVTVATKILKFSKEICSIFVNQHPNMTKQRAQEDITSYDGEGGWFLNKASFTWCINRDNGSNENRISIDNVRNKHTGGSTTRPDMPIKIHWHPCKIDLEVDGVIHYNIIQDLVNKHNVLKNTSYKMELPRTKLNDAFEIDEDGLSF